MTQARVAVVSRQGCHLCDVAEAIVADVCRAHHSDWTRIDVDADADLRARWGDHVPVVLVDDRVIAYWTLDAEALHRALRGEGIHPLPDL